MVDPHRSSSLPRAVPVNELLTRASLLEHLEERVAAVPWLLAAWEGGSAAFGRADDLSDIDLVLVAPSERVEEAFALVESALEARSRISDRWRLPEPTWHGHAQVFYRLEGASPDTVVDLLVAREGAKGLFLEPERHGAARFLFDRAGIERPLPLEPGSTAAENRERAASIRARHRVLGNLPGKELRRGRTIDALAFYQSITLRHLVELLRIRHDPFRAAFGLRYLGHDLPGAVRRRLEPLIFVGSATELAERLAGADAWIEELLAGG